MTFAKCLCVYLPIVTEIVGALALMFMCDLYIMQVGYLSHFPFFS